MTWEEMNDWFDAFYKETVETKKIIRGRAWSGSHIRIWSRNSISVVLYDPYLRGSTEESKAVDFIKNLVDPDHQEIHAELTYDRFKKIVSGEDSLKNEDWVHNDE